MSKLVNYSRIILALIMAACFAMFVIESIHWPWMNDAQVFHYIIFLIEKGMSPYRQIPDINMPGSYLSEFVGISIFGRSDLAWRLYDYSILIALTAAATSISWSYDWYAGVYAGILFSLIHGSEGPLMTAERDQVMTMLVFVGYALAFLGVRKRKSLLFFFSAIALSLAATIKPTAFLAELLLVVLALRHLRDERIRLWPYLREVIAGTSLVLLATLAFLLWRGSLHTFLYQTFSLIAYYSSSIDRGSFYFMLHYSTPRGLSLLLPLGVFLFFRNQSWRNWELQAILGGVFFGLVSYFIQGKGSEYHRYPFAAFALLWVGLEFVIAIRKPGLDRWVAVAGILIGPLVLAPFYLSRVGHIEQPNSIPMAIIGDLRQFPAAQLQGSVQCLDSLDGCYSALYRMRLKQSTGMMGDQLLFSGQGNSAVTHFKEEFLHQVESEPPTVFVETNYWYGGQTFDKINAWPEFAKFLRQNYTIVAERTFPLSAADLGPPGYRIYRRNH